MRAVISLSLILSCLTGFCIAQRPFTQYNRSKELFDNNKRDSSLLYAQQAVEGYVAKGALDSALLAVIMVSKNEAVLNTLTVAMQSLTEGLDKYGTGLPDDHPIRLQAHAQRAYLHSSNFELDSAIHYYQLVYDKLDRDPPGILLVRVLTEMGFAYVRKRDYNSARRYALQAAALSKRVADGDPFDQADLQIDAVHTMSVIYTHTSKYDSALIFAREMLALTTAHFPPDHNNIGIAHNELGSIFQNLCLYDSAVYHRKKCEEIFYQNYLKEGQGRYLSVAYGNLGYLYWIMEEYGLALEYNQKSLDLAEQQYDPDSRALIFPLASIADDYNGMGKPEKALPYLWRAYQIQQKSGPTEWGNLAYVENFLSIVHEKAAQYDSARFYAQRALDHYRQANMEDNKISVNAISLVGRALMHLGDTLAAEPYLSDASKRFETFHVPWHDNVVGMYVYRSRAARIHGLDSARSILNQAFERASLAKSCLTMECLLDSLFTASHVLNLFLEQVELSAQLYPEGDVKTASEIDWWISRYESMASQYLGQTRSDAGIRLVAGANKKIYDAGILAHFECWQTDNDPRRVAKILEYITKEKALSLRLNANNRNIQQYANLPEEILVREKQLLGAVSMRRQQMLQDSSLESRTQYSDAIEDYSSFKMSLAKTYPEYYALKYDLGVPPMTELQTRLQPGQYYIEFGFVDSLLLAVPVSHHTAGVMAFSASQIRDLVFDYNSSVLSRDTERHQRASLELYNTFLQSILQEKDVKQLIIGPDEILFQMSFESVLIPHTNRYIIEDYDVYYATSIDAWMDTPHASGRPIILDLTPGFHQDLKDAYMLSRDASDVDSIYLTLLSQPFMFDLSRSIDKVYRSRSLRGSAATESAFKASTGSYQLIHFGTHAKMDDLNPLFSRLILAKDQDDTEDGYLHTYELYGIPLNASLSVLTACETGGGMFEAGQGIQSLAHAFAYAGCPSMVMSLWKIDEKATATLSEVFYKNISKGMTVSRALSGAKREFLATANEELRHPYYWSGLVLMGSDGYVEIGKSRSWWFWILGILILGILVSAAFRVFTRT